MKYIIDHIPISKTKRPAIEIQPEYLTIHSTGNQNSTARQERNWLTNPANTRSASFHIVVDDKEAIECIPLDEMAWHAGTREGNRLSIGLEICESGNRAKTIQNAVEVAAMLIRQNGWKLKQHYDWSGKNCPRILRTGNLWDKFVKEVMTKVEEKKVPEWKLVDIEELAKAGILKDPDYWKARIDEPIPVWTVMALINRLRKER